jgi:hypothetical protein
MSNNNRSQQMRELSKITANSIVAKILRKHGLNESNLNSINEKDRARVSELINELQKQSTGLFNQE